MWMMAMVLVRGGRMQIAPRVLLVYRAVVTAGPVRTLRLLFQLASDGIAAGVEFLALLERATVALLVVLDDPVAAVPLQLQL